MKYAVLSIALLAASPALADAPAALQGRWLAEDIGGGGVIDRLQTTLEIAADGRFSGMGGCNRYGGQMHFEGETIGFGPAAATRMACQPSAMAQEAKLFEMLPKVKGFSYDKDTRKLALLDGKGEALATFANMDGRAQIVIDVPGAEAVERNQVSYTCGEEQVIADYINAGPVSLVTLTRGDDFTVASIGVSASGARYAGGTTVWWVKGDEATLYNALKGDEDPGVTCKPDA